MTTQYDTIGSSYNVFKELPTAVIEHDNVRDAVLPYLSKYDKARVLDIACGTGFYSQKLLEWGASYVHGIDLSTMMVEVARTTISEEQKQQGVLKFDVGNGLDMGKIADEEPFDMVTGVWFLNYATGLEDMTKMFQTISADLKDGGVFIGVTPHHVEDVTAFAKTTNEFEKEQPGRWGVTVDYYEHLESGDGWRTEVRSCGENKVSFKNFHLKKSVFEEGARAGGMKGKVVWQEVKLPQAAIDMTGPDFWKFYFTNGPHMGVIIVEK